MWVNGVGPRAQRHTAMRKNNGTPLDGGISASQPDWLASREGTARSSSRKRSAPKAKVAVKGCDQENTDGSVIALPTFSIP